MTPCSDMGGEAVRYELAARFDDGLFKSVDGAWVQIGLPKPPCRCLWCMTAGPRADIERRRKP